MTFGPVTGGSVLVTGLVVQLNFTNASFDGEYKVEASSPDGVRIRQPCNSLAFNGTTFSDATVVFRPLDKHFSFSRLIYTPDNSNTDVDGTYFIGPTSEIPGFSINAPITVILEDCNSSLQIPTTLYVQSYEYNNDDGQYYWRLNAS